MLTKRGAVFSPCISNTGIFKSARSEQVTAPPGPGGMINVQALSRNIRRSSSSSSFHRPGVSLSTNSSSPPSLSPSSKRAATAFRRAGSERPPCPGFTGGNNVANAPSSKTRFFTSCGRACGARQDSCRLIHAANGCLCAVAECDVITESRSGLSVTAPMADQSRVRPDHRAGLRSRAREYSACRAARIA